MNKLFVIIKKELRDIFRDKKTIIFTLLLPIVIYPAMFALMDSAMKDTQKQVEQGISIGLRDKGNSAIGNAIKEEKRFKISEVQDLDSELKSGKISIIVEIPEDFNSKIAEEKNTDIKLVYDETSNTSMMAVDVMKGFLNEFYKQVVNARIEKRGLDSSIITPFSIETLSNNNTRQEDANPMAAAIINMLPTFIILFIFTPTIAVAADLGAGEKERGTFEPLLTTAAKRTTILWGKLISISVIATITLLVSMSTMIISINFIFDNAAKSMNLGFNTLILMAIFSIILVIAISAVELSVSIYSRSMKEANSYLGGMTFIIFILTYIPFMMDAKSIKFIYFNIPLTNVVCVMKEFIVGIYNPMHIFTVAGWFIVYAALSLILAKRMFNREEVIFRT